MPMILKMNANGDGAVVSDGKPVYLDGDREILFDAPATVVKIRELSDQRDASRTKIAAIEAKFAGIEDPEAARAALQAVASLKDGKLIEAGKMDEVVKEKLAAHVKLTTEEKAALTKELEQERAEKFDLIVGSQFDTSPRLHEDRITIPRDAAKAMFQQFFKVENGRQIVPYNERGEKIWSSEKPGEPASFDEAADYHLNRLPNKEKFFRGANNGGGGSTTTTSNRGDQSKALGRAGFDALSPAAKAAHVAGGGTVTD